MPLFKGKENVGRNIRELETNGTRPRSHKQIVAIALHAAGVAPKMTLQDMARKKRK